MTESPSAALRLATYNTSLYSDDAGGLIKSWKATANTRARSPQCCSRCARTWCC